MRYASIARVYAAALMELATEKGELEAVKADVASLAELWAESPEFRGLMESPELGAEAKQKALSKLLATADSKLMLPWLLILLRRHRESLLGNILEMFSRLGDQRAGLLRGRIVGATEIDGTARERIEGALGKSTGAKVILETDTDRELLAGMVLTLADKTVDGSLRTRLGRLRDRLLTAEMGKE